MDKKEYSTGVEQLRKRVKQMNASTDRMTSGTLEQSIQMGWKKLYNADNTFKLAEKNDVLTMMRINLRFRFIPLHSFGLFVDI